jgi:hypothetical protein
MIGTIYPTVEDVIPLLAMPGKIDGDVNVA